MKKVYYSVEKEGFYGAYFESKDPLNRCMIAMLGDAIDDRMAVSAVKWLHHRGCNVMTMSPAKKDYGHHNYPLDGKPVRDKRGKVVYEPYRIKVLNTINFKKSMHYNPFSYIHSEKDILKLVTTLIANTKGEGKGGDDFWLKAETLLYTALIGYIHYEAPVEEQNFSTLIEFINAMEVREDDEEFKNPVDLMFDALEAEKPDHFAVRQYKKYKLAAGVVCSKRLLNQAVGKSLRTHNLKPKKGAQVMRKNEKITALYERLSRDDFGKDDDQQRESNSISNQKAMLEDFAARQGFTNIVHFTDDGISGTCFDEVR